MSRVLLTITLGVLSVLATAAVVLVTAGFVVWTAGMAWARFGATSLPALALVGVLLYFAAVGVHELGHLLAGRAVGFLPHTLVVGPLRVVWRGRARRFERQWPLFSPPGLVLSHPPDGRSLRARYTAFVAGGPLASLLLGGLLLAGAILLAGATAGNAPGAPAPPSLTAGVLEVAGLINLFFAFATLTPGRSGALQTDGAKLLELLLGGKRAERWLLSLLLVGQLRRGVRPREWDAAHVARLLATRDGSRDDAGANLLAYYHALDAGEVARAGELLDLALSQHRGVLAAFRDELFLEGAYYEGHCRGNASAARHWLERAGPCRRMAALQGRAEAAALLAEGRYADAIRVAEPALMAAVGAPTFCGEADLLCGLLAECRRRELLAKGATASS